MDRICIPRRVPENPSRARDRTPGRIPRRWRRRGRRAQVAPVATILGLLLVVTFIANYIATTLPSQMSANDTNHEVQVENQLGQFVALLQAYSSANAVGAQVTLPVSLGSVGAPPFNCSRDSVRHPRETKGLDYRASTNGVASCCGPDGRCA